MANKKHVYRWPSKYSKWKAKPPPQFLPEVLEDPCFWEYFVEDIPGFIDQNLNKKARIANGTAIKLHSMVPRSIEQARYIEEQANNTPYGCVISLDEPPAGLTVELVDESPKPDKDGKSKPIVRNSPWYSLSLCKDKVVIPVKPQSPQSFDVPIPGGQYYSMSKVTVTQTFPVTAGVASTIHKAQGRTLDRVIVAISR